LEQARIIGDNLRRFLVKQNMSCRDVAAALGYNEIDIAKICDGRLVVMDEDLEEIAAFFGEDVRYFFQDRRVSQFHKKENETMILDILDYWCDMKEALINNSLVLLE